ncbi:S-layer homology domain-containing protein [Paenibacillus elgii]|uniref:S-layer homology domain-containing protein n=1 Tax=Paenibacillus elgii TaxID=189691 RepID=UPI000248D8F5|nr:S-layer homology domain-containing protein [Paenibacillus elgii]
MMGLDDKLSVQFSKNLLDALRTKGIEIQLFTENSSVAISASSLGTSGYADSTLTVGRVIGKSKYGAEYTPVTSAVGISGMGAFPNTTSESGPYTLKMKIAVSTGDNRKSNVYQEAGKGWSLISSQTHEDTKRISNVSAGNYMIMDYVKHFIDINNHWAFDLVDFMARKQFVTGYSDDTFRPDRYITRSEFTTMLVRVMNDKGLKAIRGEVNFQDVPPSDWAFSYVNEGYKLGLVTGTSPETFEPTRNISREEMAAIAVRAMNLLRGEAGKNAVGDVNSLLTQYTDQDDISRWARPELTLAVKEKIIEGVIGNRMEPKSFATRAQATVVLYKVLEATDNL